MRRTGLVLACVAIIGFGTASSVRAQSLVGLVPKKPSQLLNINNFNGVACTCEGSGLTLNTLANPDGTLSSFSIPAKQVLVVTGMTWFGVITGGQAGFMSLCVDGNEVWFDTQVSGSNGVIGRSLQLGPLVFKSGHTLCGGGSAGNEVLLTGFLTKDQ